MTSTTHNCNLCFICGTKVFFGEDITLINSSKNSCSKFLTLVSRYLNLNFKSRTRDFQKAALGFSLNADETESVCCFNCLDQMQEFCDNYQKLEELEIKTILIVENISKLLATSSNDNTEFGEKFASSVKRKRIRRFPRLKLQRLRFKNADGKLPNTREGNISKDEHEIGPDTGDVGDPLRIIVKTINYVDDVESIKQEISDNEDQIEDTCNSFIDYDHDGGFESASFAGSTFLEEGIDFETELIKMAMEAEDTPSLVESNGFEDAADQEEKRPCKWKCLMCEKVLSSPYILEDHLRLHINEEPFICRVCDKSFASKKRLQEHRKSHSSTIKSAICHICGTGFMNQDQLKDHQLSHSGEDRKFVCDVCFKSFNANRYLKRHKLLVHEKCREEKPFECSICEVKFVSERNLRTHMKRKHEDNRNKKIFKCTFPPCGFTCYSNSGIVRHLRTHTGERPFKCDQCGAAFKVKSHLKAHLELRHIGQQ